LRRFILPVLVREGLFPVLVREGLFPVCQLFSFSHFACFELKGYVSSTQIFVGNLVAHLYVPKSGDIRNSFEIDY